MLIDVACAAGVGSQSMRRLSRCAIWVWLLTCSANAEKKRGARLLAPFGGVKPPSHLLDALRAAALIAWEFAIPTAHPLEQRKSRLRLRKALPQLEGGALGCTIGLMAGLSWRPWRRIQSLVGDRDQ